MANLPEGAALDISTPALKRSASWRLLKASGKPRDGWLSRHVHRKISRLFSYVFLQIGVPADVATFLVFGVGVAAAFYFAQTSHATMIAGGALYWFSSIADGIDGEIARLTLRDSSYGEQLDTAVDQATHVMALIGVLVGWWRQGMGHGGMLLAAGVLLGVPLVLVWIMGIVRRGRGLTQFFVVATPIEWAISRAGRETGAWALQLAGAIFILFRREAIAFTFFLVSLLTGQRVIYPLLIATSLLVVTATLLSYRARIDVALRAEAGRA
jgi:phosphatidylglycerophosphate synthase